MINPVAKIILISAALWGLIVLAALALTSPSPAHSWYDIECCGRYDCKSVGEDELDRDPQGRYVYRPLGVVFEHYMEKPSRDGNYHVCVIESPEGNIPRCIYVPLAG